MAPADGYYQLPPGKMANAVTWMELTELETAPSPSAPPGLELRRLGPEDAALHRRLYREVGEPWLWSGLTDKDEAAIAAHLGAPGVLSCALMADGAPAGLLDLESTEAEGVEIVYLGLVPGRGGKGAGSFLIRQAIRIAREAGHSRLWLHTCNFDHPGAIGFYRRHGFRVYAQGFEIMDDPRLNGLLPRETAPHVPMVETDRTA
jgi:GNAT superfamily N-acetyltransferase